MTNEFLKQHPTFADISVEFMNFVSDSTLVIHNAPFDLSFLNGELGILYADINQGRLPYYHRLDIALKKEHKLSKNSAFNWNLGVTNAYNRENIFYFNRIKYERVNQLPLMPSFGMSLTF